MKLKDKVYIITGATSGMGRAIAERFAGEGASLILSGRDEERGRTFEEHLRTKGWQAAFVPGDVGLAETNQALVDQALSRFGSLDGLCTNAGTLGLGSVADTDPGLWHATFATNLHSVYYLCRAAFPILLKKGRGSVVVNASIAAFKFFPNHAAYCASKAALVALAKQMAVDFGPHIRVNAICPGPVDTPLIRDSARAFPHPESAVEDAGRATLMQRLGQPNDVAELALFLISEAASWITGAAVTIDGGITAKG